MSNRFASLLTALLITAGLLVSCVPVPMEDPASQQTPVAPAQRAEATPLPIATAITTTPPAATVVATAVAAATAAATAAPTRSTPMTALAPTSAARALPTATSKPSDTPAATSTATPRPTARTTDMPPTSTIVPTTTAAPIAAAAPTPAAEANRKLIVITEADIALAVAEGVGAQQGVTIENLKVRFADGQMNITAGKVGYSLIKLQNLNLVGRLVARDGVLSMEVDSITPRGLAANFIPTMANQALATYAADWYVEDVQIRDGRVELRIR